MNGMWQKVRAGDKAARSRAVAKYLPLVRGIAKRYARQSSGIDADDAVGYGSVGLIQAVDRFDPGLGVKFSTFACRRIRGAMLDGFRAEMWGKRQGRRRDKRIGRKSITMVPVSQITGSGSRRSGTSRVSEGYAELERWSDGPKQVQSRSASPSARVSDEWEWDRLLKPLPTARHRKVVRGYLADGKFMGTIALELGISESRISQLWKESSRILQATTLAKPRERQLLKEWKGEVAA